MYGPVNKRLVSWHDHDPCHFGVNTPKTHCLAPVTKSGPGLVSYIRQSNKWYHCDDKHITETNLLTLSNNVYRMFYAKEVDLGT